MRSGTSILKGLTDDEARYLVLRLGGKKGIQKILQGEAMSIPKAYNPEEDTPCLDRVTMCHDPNVRRKRGECSGCGG